MIIRYTVPEMWLETDVIVIFILGNFYPFTPPISPKNGNFKKMKKNNNKKKQQNKKKQNKQNKAKPGGIIILHKCTKNHDHMLCCS